jgi:hypothetical protein
MVQIESETIAAIDYDRMSATMFVRFVGADWYSYSDVPPEVHAAFVTADSHGRFFRRTIRDRYRYRRGAKPTPR